MEWSDLLALEKQQPYFKEIFEFLADQQARGKTIYPKPNEYFNAFKLTKINNLKVVLLGQDPYHKPNQAHGLSFSVPNGVAAPPSLQNIFKELANDNQEIPKSNCLTPWARQGVLLLNTVLTVEKHKPNSHADIGWQAFTDVVIQAINEHCQQLVFLLWGKNAQKKQHMIDQNKHCVLLTSHPSPLSAHRGFLGCQHFSKTNQYLIEHQKEPIYWHIN